MMADKVADAVVGRALMSVRFGPEHLKHHEAALSAAQVRAVDTIGKAMLTRFTCGLTVFSHLYSFGRWVFVPHGEDPQVPRNLRFGMYTAERDALLYSATVVEVVPDDEVSSVPYIAELGPDCLDPTVDPAAILAHVADRFDRRRVGLALLDQSFIAGIGNYLRCEVMFAASVHPKAIYGDLSQTQKEAIAAAALEIPRRTYRDKGLDFMVFMRNRRPCKVCGTRIVRETIGGRPCSWCPTCQPEPTA